MNKKFTLLALALVAGYTSVSAQVHIDATTFPDANFRAIVMSETVQPNGVDEYLDADEIAAVTTLNLNYQNIADFTGLSYFTALTNLQASGNPATSIDLSALTELTYLGLSESKFTSVDLKSQTKLDQFYLSNNPYIKEVDLTPCTAIKTRVELNGNPNMTTANITGLKSLQRFSSRQGGLTKCDLTGCYQLHSVYVDDNPNLEEINTDIAWLRYLYIGGTKLRSLTLNDNNETVNLDCHNCQLTELNISEKPGSLLTAVNCTGNKLLTIDFSNVTKMSNCSPTMNPEVAVTALTGNRVGILLPQGGKAENFDELTINGESATATVQTVAGKQYLIVGTGGYNASDWELAKVSYKYYNDSPNTSLANCMMTVNITTHPDGTVVEDLPSVGFSYLGKNSDDNMNYATMYYSDMDLKVPTEFPVTAYTYKVVDGEMVVSRTYNGGDVIPAGEAVVLSSTVTRVARFERGTATQTPDPDNMLRGSDEEYNEALNGYYYYILSKPADDPTPTSLVGFYWQTEGGDEIENGAHKAYLRVPVNAANGAKGFTFGGKTTGIETVDNEQLTINNSSAWYTLDGRKLNAQPTQRGLYIHNGKKVVIK